MKETSEDAQKTSEDAQKTLEDAQKTSQDPQKTSKETNSNRFSCREILLIVLFCLFVVLFIVSFVLAFKVFPDVLYTQVNKNLRLEKGSESYDRFIKLPFPLDFKVYIFDVKNPEDVLQGGKPILEEIGPFVYKQYRQKTVQYTDCDRDEIAYTQMERFEFDEEASVHPENFTVTAVNAPLMSVYQIAEKFGILNAVVDHCVRKTFQADHDHIFVKLTVKDLLFDGYNFCKNTGHDICAYVNDIVCAIASTKRNTDTLPDLSLQFSYLNFKRREPDGQYLVKRGIDNIDTLGHIVKWNNMKYTHYWGENTTCSEVKGTDSTLYPPRIDKNDAFYIFSTDICRFVEINYLGEDTYKGVDGYLYGTSPETLMSTEVNPADDCYCSKLTKDINGKDNCYLDGVIDMHTCFGVPVLFSFPHFLWADEKYAQGVIGLNASEELHKIFLLVEPNTGTPLKGVKRIQLNGIIRPIFGVKQLVHASRVYIPLLWIEEGIALSDEYIDKLNSSYFDKVVLVEGLKWGIMAVTGVLMVISGGFLLHNINKNRKKKKTNNN